ncbi:PepSY domain-containing protein [Paracraurococcus lichenis]|uniref:PepSY domain-containing protein n=1 Tax=Paracraurococcus lichenis TaxID=3064888 RepID=A0ABT9E8H4_9PROT|nr:PepSY domain-containing protein [Paracraurococcus sp. LOR1-02]MDO9712502.1 PepSY domain-containing protein [Paracraurococcus sp. LOR1-02]
MARVLLVTLALATVVPTAYAQQRRRTENDAPTAAERKRIEAVLHERGFVRWKEIEREDRGKTWEVDDAYTADGKRFDLRLSADDLREIARQPED